MVTCYKGEILKPKAYVAIDLSTSEPTSINKALKVVIIGRLLCQINMMPSLRIKLGLL